MTLGDDLAQILPELRAQAESRMTAECTITRPGVKTWNPATLQYEYPPVTAYSGKCRVKRGGSQDHGATVADQSFIESQYEVHLPVDGSEGVRKDDTVTITVCPEDALLVGRKFTVVAVPAFSQGTARRVPVREAQ